MAIRKKTERDVFILKGGDVPKKDDSEFKVVTLRLPIEILKKLDAVIKEKPWLTRNGWIVNAINEHLIFEEKD